MNYLQRRLAELDESEALIVKYICDDFGAISIDKSYRLLVRALLSDKDMRANLLRLIVQLEQEKEAAKLTK